MSCVEDAFRALVQDGETGRVLRMLEEGTLTPADLLQKDAGG